MAAAQLTVTQSVSTVLSAVKEADIAKTIDGLSAEERVAAMKFVYRGMATGQNCTQLLRWHSALYDKVSAQQLLHRSYPLSHPLTLLTATVIPLLCRMARGRSCECWWIETCETTLQHARSTVAASSYKCQCTL